MDLELIFAGRYDFAQRTVQVTHNTFLSLTVSGLEYSEVYSPAGRFFYRGQNNLLSLSPPGCRNSFSFNHKRENFVIGCNIPELSFDHKRNLSVIRHRDTEIRMLPCKKLEAAETLYFRNLFMKIIRLKNSPVPANIFLAEQLCSRIIAELAIDEKPWENSGKYSPAVKYKEAIDNDLHFIHSLSEHCQILGYSTEHLRRCFIELFNIDPREYRLRRKLERIFLLLNDSGLSPKEIADEVGMKNVTHLYAFIRQRCGMTPGELQKKLPH